MRRSATRRGDAATAWRASYETTEPLSVRLEAMRRFSTRTEPFGLDVLTRGDVHGRRVLEIGPGTGAHAARFLERTGAKPARWTLLDRSPAMVQTATSAIGGHAPVRGIVGDADAMPLATPERFDLIVAMHVLLFVASPRRVITAAAAHLAPGGCLLVTAPGSGDSARVRRAIRAVIRRHGLPWRSVAVSNHSAERAERDLRGAFRRVAVHPQPAELALPDADWAVRYFDSMAWLADAPSRVRREVAKAVREMAQRAIDREGVFRVPKPGATIVASGPRLR